MNFRADEGPLEPSASSNAAEQGRSAATWCCWCAWEREAQGEAALRAPFDFSRMRDCPRHQKPLNRAAVFGLGSEAV